MYGPRGHHGRGHHSGGPGGMRHGRFGMPPPPPPPGNRGFRNHGCGCSGCLIPFMLVFILVLGAWFFF